jgi:hypothetical protein
VTADQRIHVAKLLPREPFEHDLHPLRFFRAK